MIKTILFDFFGVVCSPLWGWFKENTNDFDKHKADAAKVFKKWDLGEIEIHGVADGLRVVAGVTDRTTKEVRNELYKEAVIDKDLVKLIGVLGKQYRVGLLSNGSESFEKEVFTQSSLEDYFEPIIVSSTVGMLKPDSEIFIYTKNLLGGETKSILFVDDRQENLDEAKKHGFQEILYTDTIKLKKDLKQLDIVV